MTATMATRHKNGPSPVHNGRSEDTTSGTSGSTASKTQGSYDWRGRNIPLPVVDMSALSQMRRAEESNANKLKQRIQALEAQIIDCNKSKYGKITMYGQRGKNILQKSRNTLSTQDLINQGVVVEFLCESVRPRTNLLPKNWAKWREDRNSLCQMILKKVSVPAGIDGRMYWDSMLLSMTNGKFCSLRSNFKQEIFEQFQGKT
jgi:hypothetical protein